MKQITTGTLHLKGSHYEIGKQLGTHMNGNPSLKAGYCTPLPGFDAEDRKEAVSLFSAWCPGLNEELEGMADALGVPVSRLLYYSMTSLKPNCSHVALLPEKTVNGHPLVARSYEFNDEDEDFLLIRTEADGHYAHLGTSVLGVGRDDGINEHGLIITLSSCGFPVGALPNMRHPAVKGLMFWAVCRTLLDRCKTVQETLDCLKDMPIAYNMNLMAVDAGGNAALIETMDGRMAVLRPDPSGSRPWLCAANHPVAEELIQAEEKAMVHSLVRQQRIEETVSGKEKLSRDDLKCLLETSYPDGLYCPYYKEYFGTTKSMIFDPVDGTIPSLTVKQNKTPLKARFHKGFTAVLLRFEVWYFSVF